MTDQPYTPTTEDIRLAHAESVTFHVMEEPELTEANNMFDRWYVAEIAAAEQRGAIAAQLCLADNTMEHHEQTDDFPCTRCIKKAGRAIENSADRIADQMENNDETH